VAMNLWAVLLVITFLMLLAAWLLWEGLQRYGPAIEAWVRGLFARIRPHTRSFPLPGAVLSAWDIARRLGLQALVSMAVAVVACIGFVEVADEIAPDEDLGQFDTALSEALGQHASDDQL